MADEVDYFKVQRVAAEYGLDYNAFCAAHRAMLARLESAAAPVEVDAVAEGGDMDSDAWAELHRLRADAIESVSGLPWRQLAAQLRVERATLARQLAEAKASAEFVQIGLRNRGEYIEGQPPLPLALVAYDHMKRRAEQAESQLAEATRRLGEVEGLVGKWRQRSKIEASAAREFDDPDEMAWHEGKAAQLDESATQLEAALTKEPTK